MEVHTNTAFPYYLKPEKAALTMYVECIYEGQKMKGKVVDCVPFLKYEVEYYETFTSKKTTIINQHQIVCDDNPDGEPPEIDVGDNVKFTLKRGEEPITGEVQKIFDYSYYTVALKNDRGKATFTRDKLYQITYKDYYQLCRPRTDEEKEEEVSSQDGNDSVDSDFVPDRISSDNTSDSSDSDEDPDKLRVSESELKDITLELENQI